MTAEAKSIYETLLQEGPLNAVALRRAASMAGNSSSYRFNKGLDELQADFKVLPVGVAEAGAWNYAFVYECVHRYYPELLERARAYKISEAQQRLLELYLQSVGAATFGDIVKVFWWPKREVESALAALAAGGQLVRDIHVDGQKGEWISLPELASQG